MRERSFHRNWSSYLKHVAIWLLVTSGICLAAVLGIFRGIYFVMDHFLADDRFYEGVAASMGVSACGTIVLFAAIFLFVRKLGSYPRKRLKGVRGL